MTQIQPDHASTQPASRPARTGLAPGWTIDDSADAYQIRLWGKGFFDINPSGNVVVRPGRTPGHQDHDDPVGQIAGVPRTSNDDRYKTQAYCKPPPNPMRVARPLEP